MINKLSIFFQNKYFWLLILFISIASFSLAIFLQYAYDLAPCYYCIYARYFILFIGLTSICGLITYKNKYLLLVNSSILTLFSLLGVVKAYQHFNFVTSTSVFKTCPFRVDLPIDLSIIFPSFFKIGTACTDNPFTIFYFSIVDLTLLLFISILILAIISLVFSVKFLFKV